MRINLTINGVDFSSWLSSGGITQDTIERQTRSIVTLDGTEYRKSVKKRRLSVSLLELPDTALAEASAALNNPVVVNYTDRNGQNRIGIPFYVVDFSSGTKRVYGDTTYWDGISFTLEEK